MEEQNSTNANQKNSSHTGIVILIVVGILVGIIYFIVKFKSESYLTYENYAEIKYGMSYSQVVQVLDGHQGVQDSYVSLEGYYSATYIWRNSNYSKYIIVEFDNGGVVAKTQSGLS